MIGLHSDEYSDPTLANLGHNLSEEVLDQIKEFPTHENHFDDQEYVKVLKDINRSRKNLLVARKYVIMLTFVFPLSCSPYVLTSNY